MTAIAQFIREYLLAVQFFTRIPITGRLARLGGLQPRTAARQRRALPRRRHPGRRFAAALYALVQALLPDTTFTPLVAAALSTAATVLLTGGFHEDGLADTADGLGGGYDREHALQIMKDSRVGAFGAMALVLAVLAKVSLLAILGSVEGAPTGWEEAPFASWYICAALWTGHVVSRGLPLLLIYLLPHVGDTAASNPNRWPTRSRRARCWSALPGVLSRWPWPPSRWTP